MNIDSAAVLFLTGGGFFLRKLSTWDTMQARVEGES